MYYCAHLLIINVSPEAARPTGKLELQCPLHLTNSVYIGELKADIVNGTRSRNTPYRPQA